MTRRPDDSPNWGGVRPGAGAPLKYDEPTQLISVRIPISLVKLIDNTGHHRSDVIIQALRQALKQEETV